VRLLVEARNGAVGVEGGVIVPPTGLFEVALRVPDGELRPGLINSHDHLHRNHFGRLGAPPYANAYQWGHDIHSRERERIAAGRAVARRDALLRGAWKNLRAGVTSVVHHDPWEADFDSDFPIRVARLASAHSLGLEPSLPLEAPEHPFAVHLAEGNDALSANEVREMERRGLLTSRLLAVHMCGADEDGIARFRRAGAAVIWCPTSNEFLFGRGVPPALLAPGVDVLLGSDSLLTGAGSLLDELRRARALGAISEERLQAAVGEVAARRLGLELPSLDVGARADIVVLRRPLLEARDEDVALVICAGVLRVLDPALVPALGAWEELGQIVAERNVARWVSDQRLTSWGRAGDEPITSLPANTRVMR
jgi:cytosine/adenosine deaminase-related metal-dependent hydrolase